MLPGARAGDVKRDTRVECYRSDVRDVWFCSKYFTRRSKKQTEHAAGFEGPGLVLVCSSRLAACHLTSPRPQLVPGPYSPIALAPCSLVIASPGAALLRHFYKLCQACPWLARGDVKLADIFETVENAHVKLSIVLSAGQ